MKEQLTFDDYHNLYEVAISKGKNQRKLIDFLREHTFMMVSPQSIEELQIPIEIKDAHKKYSFMVRRLGDLKFDSHLAFGVMMHGNRKNKVHVYMNHKYMETLFIPGFNSNMNFTKVKQTWKFPDSTMPDYNDRKIWRAENIKMMKEGSTHQPSQFYIDHAKSIFQLSGLEIPKDILSYL
tara:strand:+ start:24700 stop:25239 length:540 start_codon:yes stop_codon:yes gene_type:complete